MARPALLAAALAAVASPVAAETIEDEQVWLAGIVTGTTAGGFAYWLEVQPRIDDGASHLGQLLIRPMAGYRLSEKVTVYGGYAHVVLPIENGPDRNEDRLFGQVSWSIGQVAGGTLSSRTRLERRDMSNGREAGWRARQMLRYVHPFSDPGKTRALVSLEGFANLNDTDYGARGGFDQARTFLGLEVPLRGRSTIEVGYLNQTVNAPAGVKRMNHIASLQLFIRP